MPGAPGLDVHSRRVNACGRLASGRKATTEHREFATTMTGLLDLAAWLTEAGCTHVGDGSDRRVLYILDDEASLTLVLANAQHILDLHLGQIAALLRAAVEKLERQADEVLRPFREAADLDIHRGSRRPSTAVHVRAAVAGEGAAGPAQGRAAARPGAGRVLRGSGGASAPARSTTR